MSERKPYGDSSSLDEAGQEAILDRIANGETMKAIAADHDISRRQLYRWLRKTEQRAAAFEDARRISADIEAEKSTDVLEEAAEVEDLTAAHASVARARSENHKWLASVRDRDRYGSGPQVEIGVNFPGLHVSALRQNDALPGGRVQEADYELVEDGEPDVVALLRGEG